MSRKDEIFEQVLTQSFDNNAFVGFVREFLNDVELVAPTKYIKEYSNFSFYVNGYYHIANYSGNDGNKIAVFSVALNKGDTVERARGIQRNFIKPLIEHGNCAGALVAFFTKDMPEKWRLSFIRLDYEFTKGKVTEKLTPAKRYSYLVGKGEPCHTAKQRLMPIFRDDFNNPSIDDLEEAFSVEKVTKEFFSLYCEKYHELRDRLEENEEFIQEAEVRHFTSEQFAKKLLGQIVFLYFVQKKGWLGVDAIPVTMTEKEYKNAYYARGTKSKEIMAKVYVAQSDGTYRIIYEELKLLSYKDEELLANIVKGKPWGTGPKDFMRKIFEGCKKAGGNFFDDYLEPLFYTGLNKNRGENGFYPALHRRIPFLNGGLFEQLDNYEWEHNNFNIPNSLFSNKDEKGREADGILDIFDRYNFTMNEDEPMEREVAIDPEMLGKVFENLLDVKDRKSKGAFYTPREIVHYMCQETLINHIVNKMKISEKDIRDFILYGDLMKDEDTTVSAREGNKEMLISKEIFDLKLGVNRLKELDDVLANVKVADLAVGSGAFPLGMLNEIVKARETLSAYMSIGMNGFEKKSFYSYDRKPYDLKVNTIKNCIFACDIEPSAVDIAKLRLWLSIVIDDEIATQSSSGEFNAHLKPRQLPNLDCNIICGNTLIDEFEGIKLINESELLHNISEKAQMTVYQGGVDSLISELISLQDKLFFTKDHNDKEEIKSKIQDIYNEIIMEQIYGNREIEKKYYNSLNMPSKPFILWQLYFPKVFRDNGGFDVVIGNPPYIGESGHKEIFREVAATSFGERFYQGKMDYFYFFFHKGLDILNENGELGLITTNYFPTATGARSLRTDFKQRSYIRGLINFGEVRVFESALGQHNVITFLTKNKEKEVLCRSSICNESVTASSEKIKRILHDTDQDVDTIWLEQSNIYDGTELYIRQNGVNAKEKDSVGSILDKMAKQEKKLGDIAEVNQGVVSGCDYVSNRNISELNMNQGIQQKDGIYVLDMTNSRDVDVFNSMTEKEKQLFRPFYKNSEIEKYNCNSYNTRYLLYLSKNIDSLDEYPNIFEHLKKFWPVLCKRREAQKGVIKPFQLQWGRTEKIFTGEKIVVPYRTKTNAFAYNYQEWFCRSDVYVITSKNNKIDLFFLLGVLNSKLNYLWLYHRGKRKGETLELFQVPLSEIPIISLSSNNKEKIALLARMITDRKRDDKSSDTKDYENEIDQILYREYHLSEKEIAIVENAGSVNEKDEK